MTSIYRERASARERLWLRLRRRRGRALLLSIAAALFRERLLAGKPDLPGAVHRDDLHQHLVPFLEYVLDLLHPRVREIRDVHEAVGAREDLHERAELHDPPHRAEIGLSHLRLLRQRADHLDRLLDTLAVRRGDGDRPVVLDVDRRSGAGGDALDHLASRSDHVLDAAGGDSEDGVFGRVPATVRARTL